MTHFSLATNFDTSLLRGISKLNKKYKGTKIVEVYGSLPLSLTGSGRSFIGLKKISFPDLAQHIKLAHKHHLAFNYLMNVLTLNSFHDKKWIKKLDRFVLQLTKAGIDSITVANKNLAQHLHLKFPELKLHVSLIAGVDTVKEAKAWDKIGVEQITLNQHTINRDEKKIRQIIKAVKCKIQLYANISCLQDCPMREAHYKWLNQQSQKGNQYKKLSPDKFILNCEQIYFKRPVELLRSPFIRPEALSLYEKIGVQNFKLSDRRDPTSFLLQLVEAYMKKSFSGNLFELLWREDRKWSNSVQGNLETKELGRTSILIDNQKLTKNDFDAKILTLQEGELTSFYKDMTELTVSGVTGLATKKFHKKLQALK